MFNIKSSNFITSIQKNDKVKDLEFLSSNTVKVLYRDGSFHTYVLDDHERITYCNLNGEIIQINEYSENGNLIKSIECTEYGYEETVYADSEIINPILKTQNNEQIQFPYPQ